MNDLAKNLLLWVIVAVVLMVVFQAFGPRTGLGAASTEVTYSQFMKDVKADRVKSV
jgi:cell division protease FtsH